MRESLSISLPEPLKQDLDAVSREEGVTRSDVVRQALADYLFFRRLRALRSRMALRARRAGVFTDEDVFERIS